MSAKQGGAGMLAIFDSTDTVINAIERLRAEGVKPTTVFSPAPDHDIEHALHADESPIRIFTLVGGLTGAATGLALPTWTSMDWPLITGGKPIISIPAWIIISFELTILFGALATIAGLFINARLPQRTASPIYDRSFSADHFGIYVIPPADRSAEVRSLLQDSGAVEIRERAQEVVA